MRARIFDLIILALLILNLFATLNLWFEIEEVRSLLKLKPTFDFNLPFYLWVFGFLCLVSFLILIGLRKKRKTN
ncbi:MAG TPA: hypothetical protein ENF38_00220 [Candidatus Aenigmarchaeota archaeon]|nr:hypothetical protein [Candidatus Aenigmarchaeota archaeon]